MKYRGGKVVRRPGGAESPKYQWLDIGSGNQFNVRVLDIRPLSQAITTVAKSPDIAKSFVDLRQNDGTDLANTSTDGWVSVFSSLEIPFPKEPFDGPLYKAAQMEDKWDIYAYESALYFARSWTGNLIYRAPYLMNDGVLVINTIESAPNYADKAAQAVLFLIASHVLGMPFPNPIPSDMGNNTEQIALYSFSLYGRNANFATLSDVTTVCIVSDRGVSDR